MKLTALRLKVTATIAFAALAGFLWMPPAQAQTCPLSATTRHACFDFQNTTPRFIACVAGPSECSGLCLFIAGSKCGYSKGASGITNYNINPQADTDNGCTRCVQATGQKPCFLGTGQVGNPGQFLACVSDQAHCTNICGDIPSSPTCTISSDGNLKSTYCPVGGPSDPAISGGSDMHACFQFKDGEKTFQACTQSYDECQALCMEGSCGFSPISVNGVTVGGSATDSGADSSNKCDCKYSGATECKPWDQLCKNDGTGPTFHTRECCEIWSCGAKCYPTGESCPEVKTCASDSECADPNLRCLNRFCVPFVDYCQYGTWQCGAWSDKCTFDPTQSLWTKYRTCDFKDSQTGNPYSSVYEQPQEACANFQAGPPGGMEMQCTPTLEEAGGSDCPDDKQWVCTTSACGDLGLPAKKTCTPNPQCMLILVPDPSGEVPCPAKPGAANQAGKWTDTTGSKSYGANLPNPLNTESIPQLIGIIIRMVLNVSGSFALLMFVYGGYMWLTSAGEAARVQKGKDIMKWATIGLLLILLAYTVVSQLFDFLSNLGPPADTKAK